MATHLLSVADLGSTGIERILDLTDSFVEVSGRQIPKVPALRGKTVVWLFYEDSTRTRLSFEQAAKRLSADTMNFSVSTSSVKKGESLRDTVQTIEAMGIDAIVVRHGSAGVPRRLRGRSLIATSACAQEPCGASASIAPTTRSARSSLEPANESGMITGVCTPASMRIR